MHGGKQMKIYGFIIQLFGLASLVLGLAISYGVYTTWWPISASLFWFSLCVLFNPVVLFGVMLLAKGRKYYAEADHYRRYDDFRGTH